MAKKLVPCIIFTTISNIFSICAYLIFCLSFSVIKENLAGASDLGSALTIIFGMAGYLVYAIISIIFIIPVLAISIAWVANKKAVVKWPGVMFLAISISRIAMPIFLFAFSVFVANLG